MTKTVRTKIKAPTPGVLVGVKKDKRGLRAESSAHLRSQLKESLARHTETNAMMDESEGSQSTSTSSRQESLVTFDEQMSDDISGNGYSQSQVSLRPDPQQPAEDAQSGTAAPETVLPESDPPATQSNIATEAASNSATTPSTSSPVVSDNRAAVNQSKKSLSPSTSAQPTLNQPPPPAPASPSQVVGQPSPPASASPSQVVGQLPPPAPASPSQVVGQLPPPAPASPSQVVGGLHQSPSSSVTGVGVQRVRKQRTMADIARTIRDDDTPTIAAAKVQSLFQHGSADLEDMSVFFDEEAMTNRANFTAYSVLNERMKRQEARTAQMEHRANATYSRNTVNDALNGRLNVARLHHISDEDKALFSDVPVLGFSINLLQAGLQYIDVTGDELKNLQFFCKHVLIESIPEHLRHVFTWPGPGASPCIINLSPRFKSTFCLFLCAVFGVNVTDPSQKMLKDILLSSFGSYLKNQFKIERRNFNNLNPALTTEADDRFSASMCSACAYRKLHGLPVPPSIEDYLE